MSHTPSRKPMLAALVNKEYIIMHRQEYFDAPWDCITVKGYVDGKRVSMYVNSSGAGQRNPYLSVGSDAPENDGFIKFLKDYK